MLGQQYWATRDRLRAERDHRVNVKTERGWRSLWNDSRDCGQTLAATAAKRRDQLGRLGIDLGQHVRVDVQGEGDGGMPQPS